MVGIADKIDTICAVFAEGKKPTGSSDPLGVRRAALGIIRTILAGNLNIDLTKLIDETLLNLPVQFEGSSFVDKFKKAAGDCARRRISTCSPDCKITRFFKKVGICRINVGICYFHIVIIVIIAGKTY